MIALILGVALVARLAVVGAYPDYEPAFDSGDYVRHAASIAAGDGYPESIFAAEGGATAFRPPLYPYLLGTVYAVAGDGAAETWGRIAGAFLGVLVVYLVFLVGRCIWGRGTGLLAAAICAVAPPLVFLNVVLISEPLFIALELGVVAAALAARRAGGGWRWGKSVV